MRGNYRGEDEKPMAFGFGSFVYTSGGLPCYIDRSGVH